MLRTSSASYTSGASASCSAISEIGSSYFEHPAGTSTPSVCAAAGVTMNTANCSSAVGDLTNSGSYTGSASPNSTFDQGGNVFEWNEAIISLGRSRRGGSFFHGGDNLAAFFRRTDSNPTSSGQTFGFRVASLAPAVAVPFLSPFGLVLFSSLLGLAGCWKLRLTGRGCGAPRVL